jgi:hypothetical protein
MIQLMQRTKRRKSRLQKKLNLHLLRYIKVHQGYLPMPLRVVGGAPQPQIHLLGRSHLTLFQELDLEHNHQLNQWLNKGSSKKKAS